MNKKARAREIVERLQRAYPDARCTLDFSNHFELMVGGILATQSTDKRVNLTLPDLLRTYPTPEAMAKAEPADVEPLVQSVGLYKNKAKALVGASRLIEEKHQGKVPSEMKDLLELPGIGRKIANLIRGDGFGIPGVVVDTHCGRIARRLGLSKKLDPTGVERDLEKVLPKEHYVKFGHLMVAHGREICVARKPRCSSCVLADICPKVGVDGA